MPTTSADTAPCQGHLWYRLVALRTGTQLDASPDWRAMCRAQAIWETRGTLTRLVPTWVGFPAPPPDEDD